ncbi:MAG: methyltransferase domain-containing protein [Candidatus Sungbacteria bacterium]|nr:methyltransferase domain-containing protein [Candidatus Sungbacteria bacterium]
MDTSTSSSSSVLPSSPTSSASGDFLHPERILNYLDIRPGMVVADFGAGSGHFTIAAARKVGESGKVYALDIQKQVLDLIKSRANLEHLLQIETVWADLERERGSRLDESSVDFVITANILFQAEKKKEIIEEARRVLKPGGALALIEWDDTPFPAGPAAALRLPKRVSKTMAENSGFELEKEFAAGSHHYGLLFKKR